MRLKNEIKLCITTTKNETVNGEKITKTVDTSKDVMQAERLLAKLFGGFTVYNNACGGWLDDETGELIIENETLVCANYDTMNSKDLKKVVRFMQVFKKKYGQDAVSIWLNGVLNII